MLYHLLYRLKDVWFGFNVFKYITFRAALGAVTAFMISLILAPMISKVLKRMGVVEKVKRPDAPSLHPLRKDKEGTPTMGGIIIIASIFISTLLWADLSNKFVLISLTTLLWLGVVGFIDDYIKLKKRSRGLRAVTKIIGQLAIGLTIGIVLFTDKTFPATLSLPFFKNIIIDLGIYYIFFAALVVTATSNAANITDGLDGLAIGCIIIIALAYSIMCYITGHALFSSYLSVFFAPRAAELTVFSAAIFGGALGFLWFNSYPATIFMGDTGSLALGGAIGAIAVFIKKELLLFLVGGIFVVEVISVILQVASFKLKGKRIFLMAPLHHHFELKGWSESKIIIRFWIIAAILALITLATLKLR